MPTWKDVKLYCIHTHWELYKKTDHFYFRKAQPNGEILRTKVSFGTGEIPHHLWKTILKKQLQTTEEDFNRNK